MPLPSARSPSSSAVNTLRSICERNSTGLKDTLLKEDFESLEAALTALASPVVEVAINVSGGVVQHVIGDHPLNVRLVDFDNEEVSEDSETDELGDQWDELSARLAHVGL